MKKTDRLATLDERLRSGGILHLREAAEFLGVSEMTVRRDLATAPHTFSYLGGYILPAKGERNGAYRLDVESDAHAEAKAAACLHAAASVEPEDTIFIDCGTTTPHLVPHLPADVPITVVCYALNIAKLLAARTNVRLLLLGGLFHPSSETFSGEEAIRSLERIGINRAFISAGGVHPAHGVSCSNFHEVPIKQAAMRQALSRTLVVDSSKFGRVKPAFFAGLESFEEIATEDGARPGPAASSAGRA